MKIAGKARRQIKVGGHIYRIRAMPRASKDPDCTARTANREALMEINTDWAPRRQEEAFLHEICHIVNSLYLFGKLSERDISAFSEGLYGVIKHNQLIFDAK